MVVNVLGAPLTSPARHFPASFCLANQRARRVNVFCVSLRSDFSRRLSLAERRQWRLAPDHLYNGFVSGSSAIQVSVSPVNQDLLPCGL